jgi:hypothetical protein
MRMLMARSDAVSTLDRVFKKRTTTARAAICYEHRLAIPADG